MLPHSLPYHATGRFARVVLDYLDRSPQLDGLYAWPMDRAGIEQAIEQRIFSADP